MKKTLSSVLLNLQTEDAEWQNLGTDEQRKEMEERETTFEREEEWVAFGNIKVTPEERKKWSIKGGKKGGKIGGKISLANGKGIFGSSKEQLSKWGEMGGKAAVEGKKGFFGASKEQHSKWSIDAGRIGGKASLKAGSGIHGSTKEQKTKWAGDAGKIGGKATFERKTGIFGATKEELSEWSNKGALVRRRNTISNFLKEGSSCTVNFYFLRNSIRIPDNLRNTKEKNHVKVQRNGDVYEILVNEKRWDKVCVEDWFITLFSEFK